MNYEQKYKKALSFLKDLEPYMTDYCIEKLEGFFSELKESEDEKIRKEIISFLKEGKPYYCPNSAKRQEWAAWLEKQDEQKPAEYALKDAADILLDALSKTPYNNKPITDAQVITRELLKFLTDTHSYNPNVINEQKTTWSEEDGKMLSDIDDYIKYLPIFYETIQVNGEDILTQQFVDSARKWLKSIKDRIQSQQKQEWSSGDLLNCNRIIDILQDCNQTELIDWLESIEPKPLEAEQGTDESVS